MVITVAVDSFKGSVDSLRIGMAAKDGLVRIFDDATVVTVPVADGGEGFFDAIAVKKQDITVTGPLGEPVIAHIGETANGEAVIEMAQAAGLPLVPPAERDPMNTTTYGVGEMIQHAVEAGYRRFIVGIGGSSTNDGGIGLLQALGFGLLDENGHPVPHGAKGLNMLRTITTDTVLPALAECTFTVACDVDSPLCGENGCSAVFAPQKGASKEDIALMDKWLFEYAQLVKTIFPHADETAAGAGAAGGLGFCLQAVLGATLKGGFDVVADCIRLEDDIKRSDLVVTGEGRLDGQSAMGKVPCGVAKLAKKYGVPVIAFAGGVTPEASACHDIGIDAYFPIVRGVTTLEDAMDEETACRNMADTAEQVARLIKAVM